MTRTTRTVCVLVSASIAIGTATAQTAKHMQREPSTSSPESGDESVFHNAPLPSDAVLDALLNTKEATESADALNKLGREEKRKLFRTVKVHLAKQNEVDWIVSGSGPMTGGDNDWFWVVRETGDHAEALLFANGLSLETLKSRANGYKDIETSWSAASGYVIENTYQYDGNRYELAHTHNYKQRQ
jgi:hypothetical protein